jgi:hypothetical protein
MSNARYSADHVVRTMDSSAPRRRAETLLEYALYAAILMMTVSGAFLYKSIVQDPQLSPFTNYLILAYLVFLALAFGQLNVLHRKRPRPTPKPQPQPATQGVRSPRPVLGLTFAQLAIVAFVFVTACVTFTWALSIVR